MPELPEVETTLRGLEPYLKGETLIGVAIRTPRLRLPTPTAAPLIGRTVERLERRAKYILAYLDDATVLVIHLGMSGRLTVTPPPTGHHPQPPAKHDHLILTTKKGEIRLHDPRRFGLLLHLPAADLPTHPLFRSLGPEPLGPAFTPDYLHRALQGRKTPIKPTLMDAARVVGVGNIYASEALFDARLHPKTPANRLTLPQCKALHAAIISTLEAAIAAGGSSLRDYRHGTGQLGYFQHNFKVYGRAGLPCPTCGTPIEKITQAQRSTFFCPRCQPLKP